MRKKRNYDQLISIMERVELISRDGRNAWPGGGLVWRGAGMKLKRRLFSNFGRLLENYDYQPMQFPRVVPNRVIEIVSNNVVDLAGGTYWFSEGKDEKINLTGSYANSTNDALVSYHLSFAQKEKRLRLPFKAYTHHQMVRFHRSTTKPFFNSDENTDLFEAYFVSEDVESVDAEFDRLVELATIFFNRVGIAFVVVDQSMWGNKPVASRVTSLQTFSNPPAGSVRLFSIYYHGDTFSRLFNLKVKTLVGKVFVQQIGFGFWEGAILPMIDHFSDEFGLTLPSTLSPYAVVLLPRDDKQLQVARKIADELAPLDVLIDRTFEQLGRPLNNRRFIQRLTFHLHSGAPLRVTFIDGKTAKVSRRDDLDVREMSVERVVNHIERAIPLIDECLQERSHQYLKTHLQNVGSVGEIRKNYELGKLSQFSHCGNEECAQNVESAIPGEFLGFIRESKPSGSCVYCNFAAKRTGLAGRRAPTP